MAGTEASDDVLTVSQIAEEFQVNPQTVYNWISSGKLPALKAGRRVRVQRSALERFVGIQQSPDLGRRSPKRAAAAAATPSLPFDREAVAAAADQIAAGFSALAAALRAEHTAAEAPTRRRRAAKRRKDG